jgi:hypothetical protein
VAGLRAPFSNAEVETSFEKKLVPLGSLRLRLIELIHHILKMNKEVTSKAVAESEFFKKLSALLAAFPWNNFL